MDRAASTLESYQTALNAFGAHIRTQGAQYIDEVNLGMLEAFKHHLVQDLKHDPNTAYHTAIIVKGAFKWASRSGRGYLAYNPAAEWETPAPVKSKRYTYTADDVSKMESGVRAKLRPIVTTLAWTGMRISELVNLRWQDVDLERRLIHVQVQDEWRPKAKRDRSVPLHPAVEAVFRQMPVRTYVFANSKGGQFVTRCVLRALKEDQAKLGMKVGDLHGFRRFFATTMIRSGVDVETVRQWGGWKSFNTMLRYLADVSAGDSVKALDLALTRMKTAV